MTCTLPTARQPCPHGCCRLWPGCTLANYFEPLVRDWPAPAWRQPPGVAPLAFAALREAATYRGCRAPRTPQQCRRAPAGQARLRLGPGQQCEATAALVARQGVYMQALSSLLRKAPLPARPRLILKGVRSGVHSGGVPCACPPTPHSPLWLLTCWLVLASIPTLPPQRRKLRPTRLPPDAALRESLQSARYLLELGCDPASPDG